jgi:hypothetical protein
MVTLIPKFKSLEDLKFIDEKTQKVQEANFKIKGVN